MGKIAARGKEGDAGKTEIPVDISTAMKQFLSKVRIGRGAKKGDTDPLDEDDEKALAACNQMLLLLSVLATWVKIILAAVAFKIAEEKLWRGQADNANEFIKNLLHIQSSTVYRYVAAGRAITIARSCCALDELPGSLDAFMPFTMLKEEAEVMACIVAAREKSSDGKITQKIARATVNEFLEQKRQDAAAKSEGKKRGGNTSVAVQPASIVVVPSNESTRQEETSISQSVEESPPEGEQPSPQSPAQVAEHIVQQLEALEKDPELRSAHIHSIMRGVVSTAKVYLRKKREEKFIKKIEQPSQELCRLLANAVKKAKK